MVEKLKYQPILHLMWLHNHIIIKKMTDKLNYLDTLLKLNKSEAKNHFSKHLLNNSPILL